jgi:hypothetical protein
MRPIYLSPLMDVVILLSFFRFYQVSLISTLSVKCKWLRVYNLGFTFYELTSPIPTSSRKPSSADAKPLNAIPQPERPPYEP